MTSSCCRLNLSLTNGQRWLQTATTAEFRETVTMAMKMIMWWNWRTYNRKIHSERLREWLLPLTSDITCCWESQLGGACLVYSHGKSWNVFKRFIFWDLVAMMFLSVPIMSQKEKKIPSCFWLNGCPRKYDGEFGVTFDLFNFGWILFDFPQSEAEWTVGNERLTPWHHQWCSLVVNK